MPIALDKRGEAVTAAFPPEQEESPGPAGAASKHGQMSRLSFLGESMNRNRPWKAVAFGLVACTTLASCTGGDDTAPGSSATVYYSVGGTVSGLSGSAVLQNNGGDTLTITANGRFTFPTALAAGKAAYHVTVGTQPAGQNCTVDNGYGVVSTGDVTDVAITCAPLNASALALFAGNMNGPGSVDGPGSAAQFFLPQGIAADGAGNLYVADTENRTIRKITPAGVVSTFAGVAMIGGTADGVGAAARFGGPKGVAVDPEGNLYVTDRETLRKITPGGEVSTLAGAAGTYGSSDGSGTAARFYILGGSATDRAGNVYVADSGNGTIRKITEGVVSTFAGTAGTSGRADGIGAAARFNSPRGVATDSAGNVYVADTGNDAIRKIAPTGVVSTLAQYTYILSSADEPGARTLFDSPTGIAVDSLGNVYVAVSSGFERIAIRKMTPQGVVSTLAMLPRGVVTGSWPFVPHGVIDGYSIGLTTDVADNVYVADPWNSAIHKITPAGAVSTFAGSVVTAGSVDGAGAAAQFNDPQGIATDSTGNVYVADAGNYTIRKITPAGVVSTLAGTAGIYGSADGAGASAQFGRVKGVATDSAGNVYAADSANHTIRKITPAGVVSTFAGTAGTHGSADGTGTSAQFSWPSGVATDGADNVYVADAANRTIRKITPAGMVSTLAGMPGAAGSADGAGADARFANPRDVATDSTGNVYVADGDTIRKITPAGVVSTLAGAAASYGSADGAAAAARFLGPTAIATDSAGNVYVADDRNSTIRKISTAGVVSTVAGVARQFGFAPGAAPGVIAFPQGLAISGSSLYIVTSNGVAVVEGI